MLGDPARPSFMSPAAEVPTLPGRQQGGGVSWASPRAALRSSQDPEQSFGDLFDSYQKRKEALKSSLGSPVPSSPASPPVEQTSSASAELDTLPKAVVSIASLFPAPPSSPQPTAPSFSSSSSQSFKKSQIGQRPDEFDAESTSQPSSDAGISSLGSPPSPSQQQQREDTGMSEWRRLVLTVAHLSETGVISPQQRSALEEELQLPEGGQRLWSALKAYDVDGDYSSFISTARLIAAPPFSPFPPRSE